jgi:hypothetical protein
MSIQKSTNPAPLGLEDILDTSIPEDFEFSVEGDDDSTHVVNDDGSVTVLLAAQSTGADDVHDANLAEHMPSGELGTLSSELLALVEDDVGSRKDWVDTYVKGLEVLGLKYDERTEPWAGACGVYSTVLAEAAIRFQSETIMETFPAAGPVKTEIIGEETPDKVEAAARVRDDMNHEITEVMQEYRPEHERMLFSLGLSGAAFKKVYFDTALDRQTSIFVPAEDVIIPWGASSAQTAERVTHVMRKTANEVKKLQVAGFYRDIELGDAPTISSDIEKKKAEHQGYTLTNDDRYQFLEIQVDYDLPGYEDPDGIALPYIITIDKGTGEVLSIYRNWDEEDGGKQKQQHFVQYTYIPGFGAYGLGLIHLIGGYARAGTSILRELVDAGQLSNLPGGLKTRGMRIKGDDTPVSPGEWRDVDVSAGVLRDNIMPLPYKEPSQVLAALLNQITEEARKLGAISDMNISDMSANAPVGTTLAILERTLKTMSAVQARVHYSMKQEFKLLARIIRDNTEDTYTYDPVDADRSAKRADYDMVEVIPVSDPNSATMAQRIMQYQAALQLAAGAPQIYDLPILHRQMLEVLGIKNAAKLVPIDDDMTPRDPISENMAFLTGKPTKAFLMQDHDAHIAVHQSFMQDPMIAQAMGQNPMAQQMAAAIQAHIAEHLGYSYRLKIQEQLGVSLPMPDVELPPEIEVQLSRVVAQAAQQLLQVNKTQAAQAQAQQQQQDPIIQMQQQELQIKGQEAQIKGQKVQGELQIKQAELQLKQQEAAAANPAIAQQLAAQQAQQQSAQGQQAHQQQLAAQQQAAQQAQQQAAQQAAAQQQAAQQAAAHKHQAHVQGLTHKQQQHEARLEMNRQQAAQRVAEKNATKGKP